MRDKIYALAKGNFTYEAPKLVIEPEKLTGEIVSGQKETISFSVSNARHTNLKGFGFVGATEITFLPVFEGEDNILECEVDATSLIPSDELKGSLMLVTDCGQIKVPYDFKIVAPVLTEEDGSEVRDYFTLQKITENEPADGLALFRDPLFKETFLYRDPEGKLIYDRLLKANTGLSGMEEFLVAYDKKQAVRFEVYHGSEKVADELAYELDGSDIDEVFNIKMNTWGSIAIKVIVEGDFIECDRKILWTDEFIDDVGRFEFRIMSGKVRQGRHFGRITFISPYEERTVGISVHSPVGTKERKINRAKQTVQAMLIRSYLAFEEGRVEMDEFGAFLQKNRQVIERLDIPGILPLKGYIAWILGDEAGKLDFYRETEKYTQPAVGRAQSTVEEYVMTLYVKYMYSRREDELNDLRALVDMYLDNGYMSATMLLVRLRCGVPYDTNGAKAVESLREQMAHGSGSPLLYSELMRLYVAHPELLHELDAVNLRTLLYGLKNDLFTEELAETVNVLAEGRGLPIIENISGYGMIRSDDSLNVGTGALLMQALFAVYKRYEMEDTLKCICTLLIRHEKRDRRYHTWYEKGVESRERLTDLFEYYIYSIDPKDRSPLPPVVLSYFQYENHLNDTRKAYLYANILSNREENPEAYEAYEPQIREFVTDQIKKERVTADLGYLYENILDVGTAMELKEHLPHVMFRHILTCDVKGIESVTVVPIHTMTEKTYPLDHGRALLEIYSPEYRLFFTDRDGNQYTGSVDYTLERFFDGDAYALICYPEPVIPEEDEGETAENEAEAVEVKPALKNEEIPENLIFAVAVEAEKKAKLDVREMDALKKALETGKLREHFLGKILIRLYDHIMERVPEDRREKELLELAGYIKPECIKRNRAGEVASECINAGAFDTAFALLSRYGRNGCAEDELAKLVKYKINNSPDEYMDTVVKWALWLFRKGNRDHAIMNYMLKYYLGDTDVLVSIFRESLKKKSKGSGLDQLNENKDYIKADPKFYESVRERLLGQVLFACEDPTATEDIFEEYFENGENRVLVKAYLGQIAYEYLVGRVKISDFSFEKIYHQARYESEPVMVLAALKKLAEKDTYDDAETDFIERSLEEYALEGRVLPFMKEFTGDMIVPYEVRTPVIVQYYSGTDRGVHLFVGKGDSYEQIPMTKVFNGIYAATLLIFAGEETKGYIYEEETGKRSKEFELRKKDTSAGNESLFEQVNAMIEAKQKGDDEGYADIRRKYLTFRHAADSLFKLL